MDIVSLSCIVGFTGDALLQILTKFMGGNSGWGLKPYFKQHGSIESLFIAGGMLAIFYIIFIYIFVDIFCVPLTWYSICIYAITLDLLFRISMIFPSLKGYYNHLNYFWSAIWAIIPMIIPFLLFLLFKLKKVKD